MDQKVIFAIEKTPAWPQISDLLATRKFVVQIRMIDGELALPDEKPPAIWQELRVGATHGMVTLKRHPDGITLIVWANADIHMRQAWNALAWAIAHLADGVIHTSIGVLALDQFVQYAELPDEVKR